MHHRHASYRQEFSDTLRTIRVSRTISSLGFGNYSERIKHVRTLCISILLQCSLHHISFCTNIQISSAFMHCKQTHVQIEICAFVRKPLWIWMFFVSWNGMKYLQWRRKFLRFCRDILSWILQPEITDRYIEIIRDRLIYK